MKYSFVAIFSILLAFPLAAQDNSPVSYTLQDRDRLIRLEAELSSFRKEVASEISSLRSEMNIRFESVDKRFEGVDRQFQNQQQQLNDLKHIFYWAFGMIITIVLFQLGYTIWDRRTAMQPMREKTHSAETEILEIKSILRQYGQN